MAFDERLMEGLWRGAAEGAPDSVSLFTLAAREGRIIGCDWGYCFTGTYRLIGDVMHVTISANRYWDQPGLNIWGGHEGVALVLSGFFNPKTMVIGGHFSGDHTSGETRVRLDKVTDWSDGLSARQ